MSIAKVAYIIPGALESTRKKPYKEIAVFFESKGIKPIPVNIRWKHTTLSDNLAQFMNKYKTGGKERTYLLGFSIGAVIALIASTKIRTKTVVLCSLSPVFKEDLPHLKSRWKRLIGKRRLNDLKNYSFNKIAKGVKCRTILVAGAKEYAELLRRVKAARRKIKNSNLILIKGAHHDISQIEYLETLRKVISKI